MLHNPVSTSQRGTVSAQQERRRLESETAKMQKMQNVPPEPEADACLGVTHTILQLWPFISYNWL